MKNEQAISKHDLRRKRGLIVFQVLMYGYLLTMFLVQMYLYSVRDW